MRTKTTTKLLGGTAALALVSPLLLTSGSAAQPTALAAAATPTVGIVNESAFSPPRVVIRQKQSVHWLWNGTQPHNVVFTSGASSATGNSGDFTRRFPQAGKFSYVCSVHGFTGTVVVKKKKKKPRK